MYLLDECLLLGLEALLLLLPRIGLTLPLDVLAALLEDPLSPSLLQTVRLLLDGLHLARHVAEDLDLLRLDRGAQEMLDAVEVLDLLLRKQPHHTDREKSASMATR